MEDNNQMLLMLTEGAPRPEELQHPGLNKCTSLEDVKMFVSNISKNRETYVSIFLNNLILIRKSFIFFCYLQVATDTSHFLCIMLMNSNFEVVKYN